MSFPRRNVNAFVAAIAVACLSLFTANAYANSYDGNVHSIGPAEGYPGAAAVWVYFDYPLSIDCSPPRACYAKSQWVYAYVNCYTRNVAVMQQISMDLNGNVVAVETSDTPQFVSGYGFPVRTYASGAPGRVLRTVCGDLPASAHPRRFIAREWD